MEEFISQHRPVGLKSESLETEHRSPTEKSPEKTVAVESEPSREDSLVPAQKLVKRPSGESLVVPATTTAAPVNKTSDPGKPPLDPRVKVIRDASAGYFTSASPLKVLRGLSDRMRANIGVFGDFMKAHPGVGEILKTYHIGFEFRSTHSQIKGFGGAAVINGRIHLSDAVIDLPQKYFMRTAVHEMGHGTLQNLLFAKKPGTGELEARNEDGRTFLEAWTILKKPENNKYFFITDLDDPHRPGALSASYGEGRRGYLAGGVDEFTAESFMQVALERNGLNAHVNALLKDDKVPAEVKDAWKKAKGVLDEYSNQLLRPKWTPAVLQANTRTGFRADA
jgi:hypothetical protein